MSDTTRRTALTDLKGRCPPSAGSKPAAVTSRCCSIARVLSGCWQAVIWSVLDHAGPGTPFPSPPDFPGHRGWWRGPSGAPADAFELPLSSGLASPGTPLAGPPAIPGRAVSGVAPPGPADVTGVRCGLDRRRVMQMRSALAPTSTHWRWLDSNLQEWNGGVATDSVASALRIPRRPWLPEHRVQQWQLRCSTACFLGSAVIEARSGANHVLVFNLTGSFCWLGLLHRRGPVYSDLLSDCSTNAGSRGQCRGPAGSRRSDRLPLRTGWDARDADAQCTRPTSTRWQWLDWNREPAPKRESEMGSRDWQHRISPPYPQTPMVARAPCAAVTAPLFHSLLPRLRCHWGTACRLPCSGVLLTWMWLIDSDRRTIEGPDTPFFPTSSSESLPMVPIPSQPAPRFGAGCRAGVSWLTDQMGRDVCFQNQAPTPASSVRSKHNTVLILSAMPFYGKIWVHGRADPAIARTVQHSYWQYLYEVVPWRADVQLPAQRLGVF